MNLKPFTKENLLSVVASLILFASVPVVLAWTSPASTPPNDNVPAPVNVGSNYQIKQGKLGLFAPDAFLRISNTDTYLPAPTNQLSSLLLGVNGKVGADKYCDEWGNNCIDLANLTTGPVTPPTTGASTTCSYKDKTIVEPLYLSASNDRTSSKEIVIPPGTWKISGQGNIGLGMGGAPKVSIYLSKDGVFNTKTQKLLFQNKYAKVQCSGKSCVEFWSGKWTLKDEPKNNFVSTVAEKVKVSASQTSFVGTLVFTSPMQEYVCTSE